MTSSQAILASMQAPEFPCEWYARGQRTAHLRRASRMREPAPSREVGLRLELFREINDRDDPTEVF